MSTKIPKIPPHSHEAEQAVLGSLLIDQHAWDRIAGRLMASDFYRHDHRLIYQGMTELAERNQPFDVITVADNLKGNQRLEASGGEGYLFELAQNTPTSANIVAYADIVHEKSLLRQLIHVGTDLIEQAYSVSGDESVRLLDSAEQRIFEIAGQHAPEVGPVSIGTLLMHTVERMDELHRSGEGITGVATGFEQLDRMTRGLQKG